MRLCIAPLTPSLAWPDPFCAAAYRLEIISGALQGSGVVRERKNFQQVIGDDWLTE